ncbi:ABC-2 transporter permease [Acetobacterium fimetarium]|uniref:ABC-2 transporter permease n=1 Tax=Acetobacterium fimetarium TaxID=52691 RepID=A0ABR6WSC1_9FIRM|nr:ABC-2 transporter permease [Acetobacterium fimetarium]MBC3803484.1 ABC-2 transporter permease [Acetobacterium fimetarium]
MKGLILKDLINLKKSMRTLGIMLLAFVVIYIPLGSESFISGMVVLMFAMLVITTMSYDDMAKWDTYALTMPISRKEVVLSKYLLMLMLDFTSVVLALALTFVGSLLTGTGMTTETLLGIPIILMIAVIFGSVLIPMIYKFGIEKARLMIVLCGAIPTAVFLVLAQMDIPFPAIGNEETAFQTIMLAMALISVMTFIASYFIAVRIYQKKEF